jgi:cell division cycle protein 20 (cofactor of APC complex)
MDFLRPSPTLTAEKVIVNAARVLKSRPEVILDVPGIVNDYYTHPLSWSKDNLLAVALGSSVYVMNESTRAVHEIGGAGITPLDENETSNYVRSVKWCTMDGMTHLLAVGTSSGFVRVYDTISNKEVVCTSLTSARSPVRALCWNDSRNWLTAGCANSEIANLDLRSRSVTGMTVSGSASSSGVLSVCNLAWNAEGTCLARGRNDNAVHLWDPSMINNAGPRLVLESHTAAVKGLAWCPYRSDMLATGGGTADGCIKLWSAISGNMLKSVSTNSQVSSLIWGRHHQELYSSHGFSTSSPSNVVIAWSYPKMEPIQSLSLHKGRILTMDMSPDGCKLASMGSDEMLCIWKVDASPNRSHHGASGICVSPSFGSRFIIR